MAVYFAGDMHLRIDQPDRSQRLAAWVRTLSPSDSLYLVGDVCDFWFAAREQKGDPFRCEGLKSLADFRARGGTRTILAGNHDQWVGDLYQEKLGAAFVPGSIDLDAFGLKIHVTHGHTLGGRPKWKGFLETRQFHQSFSALPSKIADLLDDQLNRSNKVVRLNQEGRLLPYYHRYSAQLAPAPDLVVFGHIHTPSDEKDRSPRIVVLGSWHETACFLRLDERGANHIIENDPTKPS